MNYSAATFRKVFLDASWSTAPVLAADPPEGPIIDQEPPEPPTHGPGSEWSLLDTLQTRRDQGRCLNCGGGHITYQCPEIGTMLFAPETATERIIAKIRTRIAHPHPCPGCGDLTAADRCPAYSEWECKQLDLDFAPIGWA